VTAMALPALSQPAAPPLPPPRPDRATAQAPEGQAIGTDKPAGEAASVVPPAASPPLPPSRPDRAAPPAEDQAAEPSTAKDVAAPTAEADACRERLTALGVVFEPRPEVQEKACIVRNPVMVKELAGGIKLEPASLMTCPLAEALTRWIRDTVAVEAEGRLKSSLTKVLIGTSYQCRNQTSASKLSEHAFGNGADVMGFAFAKRSPLIIDFQAVTSPEAAFQETVRSDACKTFTTVLGPGSDESHGNHLHLDLRARKGDYRICQ
ncbi:MAG: extensin family protein, partial [Microvirga sp.]